MARHITQFTQTINGESRQLISIMDTVPISLDNKTTIIDKEIGTNNGQISIKVYTTEGFFFRSFTPSQTDGETYAVHMILAKDQSLAQELEQSLNQNAAYGQAMDIIEGVNWDGTTAE